MKTYIYINWEAQEYYLSWEEVVDAYRNGYESDDFNEFLYDNYSHQKVFYFTEEERAEVLKDYEERVQRYAEEWARDNLFRIEVRVEAKGE